MIRGPLARPHVGVVLPTREALRAGTPRLLTDFAVAAEERGFGSLWAGDSLLARPLFDPLTVLASTAAVTRHILLGTGVLLAPMRQPALTAQAIASLDQLSQGRIMIGVGQGFDLPETRREFAAAGASFEHRTRRLIDTISLWREVWAGHPVSIDRPYCRLDDETILPPVHQPGGPPIWLAGFGDASFTRAGRLADGWLPYPPTADEYRAGWNAVTAAALAAGRNPEHIAPAVMVTINIGVGRSTQPALEQYAQEFYGYPLEVVSLIQASRAGTPGDIVAYLREYWDAGARVFVLRLGSLDEPGHQLELLASEVLPAMSEWTVDDPTPSLTIAHG